LRKAIVQQRLGGPTQHVNKAGGHDQAGGIDFNRGRGGSKVSHRHDAIIAHTNIGHLPGGSAPIVDGSAAQDQAVFRGL
jgi:hypothetical protein